MSVWGGFELWVPPSAPDNNGNPLFEIIGTDAQVVQFPLQPGQAITCEPGAMTYMSDGMHMEMKMAGGGFMGAAGAAVSGESPFQQIYHNRTNAPGYVACTSDIPGVLIPIDMQRAGRLKCKLGAWVCSVGMQETQLSVDFNGAKSVAGMCCGGMSFIVQTLQGGSWSFICAMGTVISRELQPGEEIIVDTNSILAFTDQVTIDVRAVGGCGAMCCAGEGAFNTVLTGPGKIWLQSMPIEKLRALFPKPPENNGGGDGGDSGGD